jgi:hypothetical protein
MTGCSAPDTLMSTVTLHPGDSATPASAVRDPVHSLLPAPSTPGGPETATKLMLTGPQRSYLDALSAGGVHPSSELLALSIGSYVCQARAAGQSPQAVWDYVHPLVSNDVHDSHVSSVEPTEADIDAATGNYIRIATERLC